MPAGTKVAIVSEVANFACLPQFADLRVRKFWFNSLLKICSIFLHIVVLFNDHLDFLFLCRKSNLLAIYGATACPLKG
jgi:hypothetical protein